MTLKAALAPDRPAPARADAVVWFSKTHWVGYWRDFPDYWTQGETPEELEDMLKSLWVDILVDEGGHVRRVVTLDLPTGAPAPAAGCAIGEAGAAP